MDLPKDDDDYFNYSSDEELNPNEKKLLKKRRSDLAHRSDSEEEVYGLLSSGDDTDDDEEIENDDIASDIEDDRSDELPDSRAWGQKRKQFYDTDIDPDSRAIHDKDLEAIELEELEARNIQERLAEQLDAGTLFSLDVFSSQAETTPADKKVIEKQESLIQEKIQQDLSQLTSRQKLDLIQKESPELLSLIEDFKEKMEEVINIWHPMKNLVETDNVNSPLIKHFVQTKYSLMLNYCTNVGLYLLLKCMKLPVKTHPVIKRLFQLRQLMSSFTEFDAHKDKFEQVIKMAETDQRVTLEDEEDDIPPSKQNGKKRVLSFLDNQESGKKKVRWERSEEDERKGKVTSMEKKMKNHLGSVVPHGRPRKAAGGVGMEAKDDNDIEDCSEGEEKTLELEGGEGDETEGKRAITYQMAKNKGLTPKRKKEQRNPRVKHRNKFKKAKIRRKGQVREVRMEMNRYGGEISGIKASVSKSIKIK